jgi:diguanylate cyclase (GGDEF)-like protein
MKRMKNNVLDIRSGAAMAPAAADNGVKAPPPAMGPGVAADGAGSGNASMEQQLADTSRLLEITSKRLLEQQRQFESIIQSLQQQAERDALTGLYNRRKFNALFANELLRCKRYGTPLSLIMVDIDRFKCVNDNFGHLVGDLVLVEVAQLLADRLREADTLSRWGGEEFMILAPHTELAQALMFAEQLRAVLEGNRFSSVGKLTCCLGVTQQGDNDTVDWMIHRADTALYHAKNNGRNRVEAFAANLPSGDCR